MDTIRRLIRAGLVRDVFVIVVAQATINSLYTRDLAMIAATLLVAASLIALALLWVFLEEKRRTTRYGASEAFQRRRRAVLFTTGLQADTIRFALSHQKPDYVGFLCTQQSEQVVSALVAEYGWDDTHWRKMLVDPRNVEETHIESGMLLDWLLDLGLPPTEIVVDVTGGTTPMSIAANAAAEARRIESQYIFSRYDANRKPIMNTQDAVLLRTVLS